MKDCNVRRDPLSGRGNEANLRLKRGEGTVLRQAPIVASALVAVLALVVPGCRAELEDVAMTRRAVEYLWRAQHEDGGWHSEVHGLARSGQSWTAFTLFHLLLMPERSFPLPESKVLSALSFMEDRMDTSDGATAALGVAYSPTLDYPVYATAYALRSYLLARTRGLLTPGQERLIPRMGRYLLDQQWNEVYGVEPDEPAYGGWGTGFRPAAPHLNEVRSAPAYADVSHTRRALEALRDVAYAEPSLRRQVESAFATAGVFLARVQKQDLSTYDGGFYYSPVLADLNKAGMEGRLSDHDAGAPLSYATATCDGLLALLAAGFSVNSDPVRAASAYLAAHDTLDFASGLPENRAAWRDILFFYHLAGRAEVNVRLDWPGDWRAKVVSLLRARQLPDGSFLNTFGAPNKEDDPIVATTLAVATLRYGV